MMSLILFILKELEVIFFFLPLLILVTWSTLEIK